MSTAVSATGPRSEGGWLDRGYLGAIAGVVFVGCLFAGHPLKGAAAAAGLWFGAHWLVEQVVRRQFVADAQDAAAAPVTLGDDVTAALAALERARTAMVEIIEWRMRTRVPAGIAVGAVAWTWRQFGGHGPDLLYLPVMAGTGALIGWLWAAGGRVSDYQRRYKDEVLPRLAASLGQLDYRDAVPPDAVRLRSLRLFDTFDRLYADDEIFGTVHGVPISVIELKLARSTDKSEYDVFDGLFVRLTLPRRLEGTTAIGADMGVLGSLRDMLGSKGGARVRVEDPEFERVYQVHGTDQVSARALLTPAFMTRFLALGERTGFQRPLAVAEGNELTVTLPKAGQGDMFEPPAYDRPADSRAALARLHDDLAAVLQLADAVLDLDQSSRGRGRGAVAGGEQ